MTVAANVAAHTHQAEYILCVEGIGWPVDEHNLASGFHGAVFSTGDLAGTLASVLGCTVYVNLEVPRAVSETYDPRSLKFSRGSCTFNLRETSDSFLLSTIQPLLRTGKSGVLQAALAYNDLEVRIDNATTTWNTGDVIWVAGQEAIKLGTRTNVAGSIYRYPSSTRAYVGTQRGKMDPLPTGLSAFTWPVDTVIHGFNRYWYDRRCLLFLHIPGEAATECVRLGGFRLRPPRATNQGVEWVLPTVTDPMGLVPPSVRTFGTVNQVFVNQFINPDGSLVELRYYDKSQDQAGVQVATSIDGANLVTARRLLNIWTNPQGTNHAAYPLYALGYQYAYRNRTTGGTAGVRTAIDTNDTLPQAATETIDGKTRRLVWTLMRVGKENFVRAMFKHYQSATSAIEPNYHMVQASVAAFDLGSNYVDLFTEGSEIEFFLDNHIDFEHNRYVVNNSIDSAHNPINVLLCHLTTMPNEFYIGDTAAGCTSSALNFTAPGWTTNQWAGYALHCVEGSNLGEARVIVSNDSDTLTVSPAFTNAPASGLEYQIRNSIYDVLPLGWGLGVHNKDIDIASFERVRDDLIGNEKLGRFAISEKQIDQLWALLYNNICLPYGIFIYTAIGTGKLSARYIGSETLQDLLDETYVSVTSADILELGDIDLAPRAPTREIILKTRNAAKVAVGYHAIKIYRGNDDDWFAIAAADREVREQGEIEIPIRTQELDDIYAASDLGTLKVTAMFNSIADAAPLITRLTGKLRREATPAPECMITLPIKYLVGSNSIQAGSLISITDTTVWNPINPYTGSRGWSGMICRVLSTEFSFGRRLGVKCKIQLLDTITAGKIAPAAIVTSKGNDANGDYVVVQDSNYTNNSLSKDWYGFAVADRIELRDLNGAYKEGAEVIKAFGSNQASTPQAASDSRIYINGTWASAISAGDYVTFSPWSGSNTSNMDTYAAYASAAGTLTGGDDGRKYA